MIPTMHIIGNRIIENRVVRALVVGVLSIGIAAPAAAAEFGTPVEYELVFPVAGEHHFSDTFWAARSHGVHSSQDVFADKGVPVVAAADGVVRYVNWTSRADLDPSRCCSVVVDHDDGWQTSYLHLDNDSPGTDDGRGWGIGDGIAPGVRVEAGDLLGWVGDSQAAEDTPPHLHFELRDPSGTLLNPYPALVAAGGHVSGGDLADPAFEGSYATRRGDRGFHVRRLQEVLVALGFAISVDGDFGPATEGAVTSFQSGAAVEADGLFGSMSKHALAEAYAALAPQTPAVVSTLRRGSRGDDVVVLQEGLSREGYNPGGADGIFGPRTEEAVIAFQSAESLVVDGIAGPQTLRALGLR